MSAYRDKCCRSVDYFFADPDHIVADPYYFIANRIIFLPIRIITDSDKNLSRQLCLPQAASQQRPCKEQQLFQGFEPPQSPRRHLLSAGQYIRHACSTVQCTPVGKTRDHCVCQNGHDCHFHVDGELIMALPRDPDHCKEAGWGMSGIR